VDWDLLSIPSYNNNHNHTHCLQAAAVACLSLLLLQASPELLDLRQRFARVMKTPAVRLDKHKEELEVGRPVPISA